MLVCTVYIRIVHSLSSSSSLWVCVLFYVSSPSREGSFTFCFFVPFMLLFLCIYIILSQSKFNLHEDRCQANIRKLLFLFDLDFISVRHEQVEIHTQIARNSVGFCLLGAFFLLSILDAVIPVFIRWLRVWLQSVSNAPPLTHSKHQRKRGILNILRTKHVRNKHKTIRDVLLCDASVCHTYVRQTQDDDVC